MKIAFIVNGFGGKSNSRVFIDSGGTRIWTELLKNWKNKSEIILVGPETITNYIHEIFNDEIEFIQTDVVVSFNNSLVDFIKCTFRRAYKGIVALKNNWEKIKNIDYIYSTSDFYSDFVPALYTKLKNPKIKWIAGYYLFAPNPLDGNSPYKGKNWLRGFFYWLTQRLSYFFVKKYADYVFVTSDPDVKKFITKKRNRSKIIVVQGGVDITESEKYFKENNIIPVNKRMYDACFVGRFHYQKGVLELIDIWKRVCELEKGAKLAMIGIGPLEDKVREKIKNLKLEDNINLLGFMDGPEKYNVFKESKLILHPAIYDSGGMASAEGMAWGLPGVSFDLEALRTYYPKGFIKTAQGNKKQFAENIFKLLKDNDLYDKISKEARDLVVEVWDWNIRAKKIYSAVFEKTLL
ncbi:MAG: glycosyltransferase family 4 protein [Patescibacteria group bacterium]